MNSFILKLQLENLNGNVRTSGKKALDITAQKGNMQCKIYCDFKDTPLVLMGKLKSDNVNIVFRSHRIELWNDDVLLDEEWPGGNIVFSPQDALEADISTCMCNYADAREEQPAVLGTFKDAEGWKPCENVFVGDCMPYTDDGRYHVLYLKDRHHHQSKWGLGAHQWEHISTSDFVTWSIHPMAVPITDPSEGSICTGSHIRKGNVHYLYYTVRTSDGSPASICRSLSGDGYHFEKDKSFSFKISPKYDGVTARDPKIILADDGMYHMLLTTRLIEENKGCLAHLVSKDLETWTELDTPEHICEDFNEPECPDYIEYNGYYYLIYSLHGKAYYKYSKEPFGNWLTPKNPEVPCSSVPKGAVWQGEIVFTGFNRINCYAGTMTFKKAVNNPSTGELVFK